MLASQNQLRIGKFRFGWPGPTGMPTAELFNGVRVLRPDSLQKRFRLLFVVIGIRLEG